MSSILVSIPRTKKATFISPMLRKACSLNICLCTLCIIWCLQTEVKASIDESRSVRAASEDAHNTRSFVSSFFSNLLIRSRRVRRSSINCAVEPLGNTFDECRNSSACKSSHICVLTHSGDEPTIEKQCDVVPCFCVPKSFDYVNCTTDDDCSCDKERCLLGSSFPSFCASYNFSIDPSPDTCPFVAQDGLDSNVSRGLSQTHFQRKETTSQGLVRELSYKPTVSFHSVDMFRQNAGEAQLSRPNYTRNFDPCAFNDPSTCAQDMLCMGFRLNVTSQQMEMGCCNTPDHFNCLCERKSPPMCKSAKECGRGEYCARYGVVPPICMSWDYLRDLPNFAYFIVEESAVCVASHHLRAFSSRTGVKLLYANDVRAPVLCDVHESCATDGHMVVYKGVPFTMKSYCELDGVSCRRGVSWVNSLEYVRRLRVPSRTEGLQFTTLASRFGSRLEEKFLSTLVHLGI